MKNFFKDYRYIFSYSETGKLEIFLNLVKLLFFLLVGKRFVIKKVYPVNRKTPVFRPGINRVNNNKLILDLKTAGISRFLFIHGKREVLDTDLIRQEVRGDMNVLDIGSNIGYYPVLEASLLDKGKVYAFEPDPRNMDLLKKNIKLNNFSEKIEFYPYAVAEENCLRRFNLAQESNLSSFTKKDKIINSIEVKCVKLDDWAKEKNIDFIRMDVEGYESLIIAGMIDFLENKRNIKLLIEVHPAVFNIGRFNFLEELRLLRDFGFQVKYLISAGKAEPEPIIERGYKPIRKVREGRWSRGLYPDVKMDDLLCFLKNDKKIVRSIFLCK